MTMSTQTLTESSRQMNDATLVDTLQIYDVGEPVTDGIHVTRALTPVGGPVRGLLQTTQLANAVESRVDNVYSVKVSIDTPLRTGQAVRGLVCLVEPTLTGHTVLVDKVSGSIIRKGVASDSEAVNQEGKGSIA